MMKKKLILETINMIKLHNLDIRTVTMAISLRDCVSEDIDVVCEKIYNKITKYAKNLVEYADELENVDTSNGYAVLYGKTNAVTRLGLSAIVVKDEIDFNSNEVQILFLKLI